MAYAQPKEVRPPQVQPQEIGGFTPQQLGEMVGVIFGPAVSQHPSQAETAAEATLNTLQLWEVLRIVQGGRPRREPQLGIYNRVMERLRTTDEVGENETDQQAGIRFISAALIGSLRRANELAQNRDDYGDRVGDIEQMILEIQNGMVQQDPNYDAFHQALSVMDGFFGTISGREEAERGRESAGSGQPPVWNEDMTSLGHVHWLTGTGEGSTVGVGGIAEGEMVSIFGGDQDAAQAAVDNLANLRMYESEGGQQSTGCQDLYNSLQSLTHRGLRDNSIYQDALTALLNNNRTEALNLFRQLQESGGPFAPVYDLSGEMAIVTLSQRAITVCRAGVEVVLESRGGMNAWDTFSRFMPSGTIRTGEWGFRLLYATLGMYYDLLTETAQRQNGTFDVITGVFTPTGEAEQIVSDWRSAATVSGELVFGTNFGRHPVQIVVQVSGGYRNTDLGPISVQTASGEEREVEFDPHDWYLGVSRIEIRNPGRPGQGQRYFRIERGGVAAYGTQTEVVGGEVVWDPNVLGYATFSTEIPTATLPRLEANRFRLLYTPHVSYLLDHLRAGGQLDAEFLMRFRNDMILGVGGNIRVDTNITGGGATTFEGSGNVFFRPFTGLEFAFSGGAIGDLSGPPAERLPPRPAFSLIARTTPGRRRREAELREQWARGRARAQAAVPVPAAVEWNEEVRDNYTRARTFLQSATGQEATDEGAQAMARNLALAILNQMTSVAITNTSLAGRITRNEHYTAALRHLRAGRLREGMQELGELAAFRGI